MSIIRIMSVSLKGGFGGGSFAGFFERRPCLGFVQFGFGVGVGDDAGAGADREASVLQAIRMQMQKSMLPSKEK